MSVGLPVERLQSLHASWQQELQAAYHALTVAHQHCSQLDTSHASIESFQSSLFAVERRLLLSQLQTLCRDKLALKKQLHRYKREATQQQQSSRRQQQLPPAAITFPNFTPASASDISSTTGSPLPLTSASTTPSTTPSHPSASARHQARVTDTALLSEQPDEVSLRLENEDLRAQVRRLREGHQSLLSLLRQKDTDIAALELTIQRLKAERQRAAERLRDAEEREQRQVEQLTVMQDVMRRAMEKERQWMEDRAEMERKMAALRQALRRAGGAAAAAADGDEDVDVLRVHGRSRDSGSVSYSGSGHLDVMRLRSSSSLDSDSEAAAFDSSKEEEDELS